MSFYNNNFKGKLDYLVESTQDDEMSLGAILVEGLTRDGEYRLNRLINEYGVETAAHKLVDHFVSQLSSGADPRQFGTSDDHTNGIISVIGYLESKNFGDAVTSAKTTASQLINT